ncbi:hypothetical protein EVAR_101880_1 [Eumeta japonica]|uniref:Uncharacterized protein n=1 Tax=Eumeta variegata TaxID=151549 RepID=A0A4C1SNS7_EUMVA|nr:hypothetical protein EVAR_101880_1 [Eumeta japonica]
MGRNGHWKSEVEISTTYFLLFFAQCLRLALLPCLPGIIAEGTSSEVDKIKLILVHRLVDTEDPEEMEKHKIEQFLEYVVSRPYRYRIWRVLDVNEPSTQLIDGPLQVRVYALHDLLYVMYIAASSVKSMSWTEPNEGCGMLSVYVGYRTGKKVQLASALGLMGYLVGCDFVSEHKMHIVNAIINDMYNMI